MIGSQLVINPYILLDKDCPITKIKNHSPERIVDVITQEFWKEWQHLLVYSESTHIHVKNLGMFELKYSKLRGYIRKLVKVIRGMREDPVIQENLYNPETKVGATYLQRIEDLKIAWKQKNNLGNYYNEHKAWREERKKIKTKENGKI